MEAAHQQPAVLKLAADVERLAALEESNKLLEDIQKVSCFPSLGSSVELLFWPMRQSSI